MRSITTCLLAILFFLFSIDMVYSQVRLRVRIDNGNSSTTCTDGFFGGAPDPYFGSNTANQGWDYYQGQGICLNFHNLPYTQYDETFNCASNYPANLQVCVRAFEEDGICGSSRDCQVTNCQNFATPAPGGSISYSLSVGGSSSATINFTIFATGSFNQPGAAYNTICNAVNLGTLSSGGTIGNFNLSNYGNFCADNVGDPNPWGGNNDQGVWFQFTTSNLPAAVTEIRAKSDPQNIGDNIDLQLAIYESDNNSCTGNLTLLEDSYFGLGLINDEDMSVNCLRPNTTYFILVDGENTVLINPDGQQGYFGIQVENNGVQQAADLICDAEFLGLVPAGGSVGTPNLSRSNVCATNTNDPTPGSWTPDKSVWFQFQAPPSGHVIINADSDLPFPIGTDAIDLQLAVYESDNNTCTGNLTNLSSDYTPVIFDEQSEVRCLTPGQNYWILVDGSALNVDGIFDITVNDGGIFPAPNDLICDAIPLGNPGSGGTVGLTNQNNYCADNLFEPIPSNWGNDQGVWYTFIAPPSGKVEIILDNGGLFSSDNIDLQVAVYDLTGMVCSGVPNEIRSEHDGIGIVWDENMEVECLIPGREYWILVDGEGSILDPDLQVGIFDISVYGDPRDPPAPNDDPCNALALGDPTGGSVGTSPVTNHGSQNNFCATATGEPQPSQFTADQTVWYTFVAPSTGNVNIQLISDDILSGVDAINLQIAVYETPGCNGPWREHVSGDDLLYDVNLDVFCLTPGLTYYVQVDGAPPTLLEGHEGYFDIQITEIPPIPVAPNDSLCNAIALGSPWNGPISITNQQNLCADDLGDPNPSAFGTDQTVWYSFTTPATGGPYAVDIQATSSLPWPFGNQDAIDLQLAVFQSSNNLCTGSLTEVESEYDFLDLFNEFMRVQCLEAGMTYYLMVDGSFLDVQGYFDLDITVAPSVPIPTNDLICQHEDLGAVPIGGSINNGQNYFNYCADIEPGEPAPFGIEQTVWFSFLAPNHGGVNTTANVTISVQSDPANLGDDVDLQLAVYESSNNTCTGSLTLLENGSSDPLFSFDASVDVTCLYPGQRYWVQVDGTILNQEGYFQIRVDDNGSGYRPPYNIICNAEPLGVVPNGGQINNNIDYTNLCSDTEPGEPTPNAFSIDKTVWFTFTAPASGNVTIDAFSDPNNVGNDIDLQLALYYTSDNTCTGTFLEVDSDYDIFNFDEQLTVDCLEGGRTYWLQVDGSNGVFGDEEGWFTLRIRDDGGTSNFPYNNNICNAYNFGIPSTTQTLTNESNVCANVEPGEPGLGSYATHTVWYQFTAPPSGRVEIDVVSTNFFLGMDPEVRVFSSDNNSCTGSLSQIEVSDWPTALIPENIEATCLIPGNTYFIQVDGSGLVIEGTFDISIEDMFPNYGTGLAGDPQPSNNDCNGAIGLTVQQSSCLNGNGIFQTYNYGYPTITYDPAYAQNCGGNCGDTWYQFTMPASGNAVIEGADDNIGGGIIGDFSDLVVIAYTGSCNGLTPIECDQGGLFSDVSMQIAAAPGTTIWLQVFNDNGDDDNELYQLCVSEGCGYDDCLDALALPIQPNIPYCFNTAGASGENIPSDPGYNECGEGDSPENSIYYYFVSDCNGSDVTLQVINAVVNGNCLLGITPTDGFNISLFQDNTPCDGNPDTLVDCQQFTACDVQPINWSFTYTGLQPNTPYVIQIDGGFASLGGDNAGEIMITTTTDPVIIPTTTDESCLNASDGTATATVIGGVGPFTFVWSDGQTDSIATGLTTGTYQVTATGSNGCTDTASVTINGGNNMTAAIASSQTVNCPGNCDGQATAIGIGGSISLNYTYQWDAAANSQTTSTATGLCVGTYSVTVYDDFLCFDTTSVTISAPNGITAQLDSTVDATCQGNCDGIAYISATGGSVTGSYTYIWPNGASTPSSNNLCAGTFVVTVTDDVGCQDTVSVTIQQPIAVQAVLVNQINVDCYDACNGNAIVSASGGNTSQPYQFIWSDSSNQTTAIASNLCAGTYSVTISDVDGCIDTILVDITQPDSLSTLAIISNPISCFNDQNGQASLTITGGTAPYQFNWSNGQSTNPALNLDAQAYSVTVIDSNGCSDTSSIVLTQPTQLVASAQITSNYNGAQISCSNGNDGSAQVIAQGGTPPYTYQWINGQSTANATNLMASTYIVTVTDSTGCTDTSQVTLTHPPQLIITPQVQSNYNGYDVSCFTAYDGVVNANVSGGTGTYSYLWSDGQTTSTATSLSVGTYAVTVIDQNGCVAMETDSLEAPPILQDSIVIQNMILCNGQSNGSATVLLSGGVYPFTFIWDNGELDSIADSLSLGYHWVTITDANGCQSIDSMYISQPDSLQNTFTVSAISCPDGADGQLTSVPYGGTSPFSFIWSTGISGNSINQLDASLYTVTITDVNGCVTVDSLFLDDPADFQINISMFDSVTCFGSNDATLSASVIGGTGPYSYTWTSGSTDSFAYNIGEGLISIFIVDANGCIDSQSYVVSQPDSFELSGQATSFYNGYNISCFGSTDGSAEVIPQGGTPPYGYFWQTGQNTQIVNNIGYGNYVIYGQDANGCTDTAQIFINGPDPLNQIVRILQHVSCYNGNDGIANVLPYGGVSPYQFIWDNGDTTQISTNLSPGIHYVTVIDANGCISIGSGILTAPFPIVEDSLQVSNITCFGGNDGAIFVDATGGYAPYLYNWSNGDTSNMITNLSIGTYTVTVTDTIGCTAVFTYQLTEPNTILNSFTDIQSTICSGDQNGSATVNPSGGVSPYRFEWNGDPNLNDSIAYYLPTGLNIVRISDSRGCSIVDSVYIDSPDSLIVQIYGTDISCYGKDDGRIELTVSGGQYPYQFNWSNGQTDSVLTSAQPFINYACTVTDANGCSSVISITLDEPAALQAYFSQYSTTECNQGDQGYLEVSASQGSTPYSFAWSNGITQIDSTQSLVENLTAGTYEVTITDQNGCQIILDTFIVDPDMLVAEAQGSNIACFGGNDGYISIQAAGGTPPYYYFIVDSSGNIGQPMDTIRQLTAGSYQVGVLDVNGCTFITQAIVTQNDSVQLAISPDASIEYGQSVSLFVQMIVNAPTNPVVTWTPSQGLSCTDCYQPTAQPSESTLYTVSITGDEGCTSTASVFIDVTDDNKIYIPNAFSPNNDNVNDVFMVYSNGAVEAIEQLLVFDRWGELVCQVNDGLPNYPAYGWDGTFNGQYMNTGVFVYMIKVRYFDGSTQVFKGDLTLIR